MWHATIDIFSLRGNLRYYIRYIIDMFLGKYIGKIFRNMLHFFYEFNEL